MRDDLPIPASPWISTSRGSPADTSSRAAASAASASSRPTNTSADRADGPARSMPKSLPPEHPKALTAVLPAGLPMFQRNITNCYARVEPERAGSARLAAEHEHARGREHAPVPDHNADVDAWYLGGSLAPHLPDALLDREHAVHAGAGVRQSAAVGVQRQPAARLGIAVSDERSGLALRHEPE